MNDDDKVGRADLAGDPFNQRQAEAAQLLSELAHEQDAKATRWGGTVAAANPLRRRTSSPVGAERQVVYAEMRTELQVIVRRLERGHVAATVHDLPRLRKLLIAAGKR